MIKFIKKYKEILLSIGLAMIFVGGFFGASLIKQNQNIGADSGLINFWSSTSTPYSAITVRNHAKNIYTPFSQATTSQMTATTICLVGDSCRTTWPSGSAGTDPFTHPAVGQSATTSLILLNGQATTTQLTTTGSTYLATTGGNVGIGTTNPGSKLETVTTDTSAFGSIFTTGYGSGATTFPGIVGRSARGTSASPTATQVNDYLMYFGGRGYGTSAMGINTVGAVTVRAAEAFTDSAQGAYLTFETAPIGSATRAERVRIDSTGNVGIGTTDPATPLSVKGTIRSIVSTAGTSYMDITNLGLDSSASDTNLTILAGKDINFQTYIGGTQNRMTILEAGNVGIGTTTPGQNLK